MPLKNEQLIIYLRFKTIKLYRDNINSLTIISLQIIDLPNLDLFCLFDSKPPFLFELIDFENAFFSPREILEDAKQSSSAGVLFLPNGMFLCGKRP